MLYRVCGKRLASRSRTKVRDSGSGHIEPRSNNDNSAKGTGFPNAMWDVRRTFLREKVEQGRLVFPIHDGFEINCLLSPVEGHE
jgi:hypothetical protein